MARRRITGLDGTTWTVRRRWTPRYEGRGLRARWAAHRDRRRSGASTGDDRVRWYDWLDPFSAADSGAGIVIGVVAAVVIVVLVLWGAPLLLALLDLLLVALVVVGGVVARLLFRRPWHVEAVGDDGRRIDRHAVGWRGSAETIDELAAEIAHGRSTAGQ